MDDEFSDIMRKVKQFYTVANSGPIAGAVGATVMQAQAHNDGRAANAFSESMRARRQVLRDMVGTAEAQVEAKEKLVQLAQRSQRIGSEPVQQALPGSPPLPAALPPAPPPASALPAARPALTPYVSDDTVQKEAQRLAIGHPQGAPESHLQGYWVQAVQDLKGKGYDEATRTRITDAAFDLIAAAGG